MIKLLRAMQYLGLGQRAAEIDDDDDAGLNYCIATSSQQKKYENAIKT